MNPLPPTLTPPTVPRYLELQEKLWNTEPIEECIVEITISGRHLDITPAIRQYAEEKAGRLPKFYDLIHDIEIILDGNADGHRKRAEIVAIAEHKNRFVAHHEGDDLYGCIDQAVHKVQTQVSAHKDRHRNRKHNVE